MKKTVFLCAGEVSGDRHAARVVDAIKKQHPRIHFIGIGGQAMANSGVELIGDITTHSTIGIFEPIKHLIPLLSALGKAKKTLKTQHIDAFIPIDSQGFNMPLAKYCHTLGIPTVYYIGPQEWQWGTQKGMLDVIKYCTKILCIFKEEHERYLPITDKARFVGHPITDVSSPTHNTVKTKQNTLTLFPGSRAQELKHTAPLLIEAAVKIKATFPSIKIIISVVDKTHRARLEHLIKTNHLDAELSDTNSLQLISESTLSLSCSGTITLEHAMLGTPIIAVFKWNPISYSILNQFIGKKWRKNVGYISLPNSLRKKKIMPEFLQNDATSDTISKAAIELLSTPTLMNTMKTEFAILKEQLGNSGTADRAAAEICETLYNGRSYDS